jgi:hypothetical protein
MEGADEMATRKTAPLDSGLIARKGEAVPARTAEHTRAEPIAVTVKLDPDLYFRLKRYGMRTKPRKTNQAIMVEALTDYLAAVGG